MCAGWDAQAAQAWSRLSNDDVCSMRHSDYYVVNTRQKHGMDYGNFYSGIPRERHDDYVENPKKMLIMDSRTLREFEYMCGRANDTWDEYRWKFENDLKENLTGEYFNTRTRNSFQYMKYNIPPDASEEFETFMRDLNSEYEALNSESQYHAGMRHHW
jgi:hypothetical protein